MNGIGGVILQDCIHILVPLARSAPAKFTTRMLVEGDCQLLTCTNKEIAFFQKTEKTMFVDVSSAP